MKNKKTIKKVGAMEGWKHASMKTCGTCKREQLVKNDEGVCRFCGKKLLKA